MLVAVCMLHAANIYIKTVMYSNIHVMFISNNMRFSCLLLKVMMHYYLYVWAVFVSSLESFFFLVTLVV